MCLCCTSLMWSAYGNQTSNLPVTAMFTSGFATAPACEMCHSPPAVRLIDRQSWMRIASLPCSLVSRRLRHVPCHQEDTHPVNLFPAHPILSWTLPPLLQTAQSIQHCLFKSVTADCYVLFDSSGCQKSSGTICCYIIPLTE